MDFFKNLITTGNNLGKIFVYFKNVSVLIIALLREKNKNLILVIFEIIAYCFISGLVWLFNPLSFFVLSK